MQPSLYWRLSGFYFFYFAFIGAFAPYWSLYLKFLGFTALQIGILMSLLQVVRIFSPTAWGWLADRSGRRILVVQCAATLGLAAYCGVFFGTQFWWLFTVMALMSFFWSGPLPLVEATTLTLLGKNSGNYGQVRLWGSIGFVVTAIAIGYILDATEIVVLLYLVLVLKFGILFSAFRVPDCEATPHHSDRAPLREIVAKPEVIAFFVACFLMSAAHGPFATFFPIYLVDHGYSKAGVGWLISLGAICEIGAFLGMARLVRFFSLRGLLILSFTLAVVRFLLIGWGVESLAIMIVAQAMHAATFATYHGAAVSMIHRFFKGRHQATGQALYLSLTFGAGGTVGALYSGFFWDKIGPGFTFTIASACALVGLVLLWWKVKLNDTAQ
jgi:MFS transporter, PPP family, 3-phenylpropionic acid transporter